MSSKHNSVFICYRRDASSYMARAIFQDLRAHNYDVFMDVETLEAGNFDSILLNQIKARTHFLLLLAPGTLERCAEPDDWLRREIETALEADRNIILLFTEHFNFKQNSQYLTGNLTQLQRRNGINVPHDYFDAAMEKLRTRFLIERRDIRLATVPIDDAVIVEHKLAEAATEPPVKQDELTAEAHFNRGIDKSNMGDWMGAIEDWSAAIRLQPDYAEAYINRGVVRRSLGLHEAAIADYDQAIRLKPNDAEAYNNRGATRRSLGQYEAAIADYDQAIRLKPNYAGVYFNRANAHTKLGQYQAALADYDQAIHLQPDYIEVYYNRGVAYKNLAQYQKAIDDYQHYLDLGGGLIYGDQEEVEGWIRELKKLL